MNRPNDISFQLEFHDSRDVHRGGYRNGERKDKVCVSGVFAVNPRNAVTQVRRAFAKVLAKTSNGVRDLSMHSEEYSANAQGLASHNRHDENLKPHRVWVTVFGVVAALQVAEKLDGAPQDTV